MPIVPDRPPPIRTNRVTRSGADYDTLALNARRDATGPTFDIILQREAHIARLCREAEWREKHTSRFTARWFHAQGLRILYFAATVATLGYWTVHSPDAKEARVAFFVGMSQSLDGQVAVERGWVTADMTQHQIDSIVATLVAADARRAAHK